MKLSSKILFNIVFLLFLSVGSTVHAGEAKIKLIAFDAFPIFNPTDIAKTAEAVYPGKGKALMAAWRTRLFEYQWLRALAGEYEDFMSAADSSLVFATHSLGLTLTREKKDTLLKAFKQLNTWPDVENALAALKDLDVEFVFLSNMTEEMLSTGLKRAGLLNTFKAIYSTDKVHSYKPAKKAYQLAIDESGLDRDEILFVAFAGWDVAGAKWFGYRTFWVNRAGSAMEELGVKADGESRDLSGLVKFVREHNLAVK